MGSRLRDSVRFLFELFCEVSPGVNDEEPYILKRYPEFYKNEDDLKNVARFTFPCHIESSFVQKYSFVLTSGDSKYSFGFCRYDPNTNTSLVLLSHLPWHDIFYDLLNCIATLLNSREKDELVSFLEACRIRPPMPGHTLKVTYNAGRSVFSCQSPDRSLPRMPDNHNLVEYFSALEPKCMVGLWAALLNERRVAVVASKLTKLTACVQAANATLYPMSWQHIFIPILPRHLVDYLLAPMPFLIGVPRSVMSYVRMSDVGDIVILDVDKKELRSPFNDLESLPSDLVSNLKKELSENAHFGDNVSRAFLRALVYIIGGYREALKIEEDKRITFNRDAFVGTRKNMQPFLEKIQQSQIFQQFKDERLEILNSGRGFIDDEFEVECNHFADRLSTGSSHRLKQQYRDWAKSVKKEGGAFFRNVKDKANPAVQSAVQTVRQGGRNVKSAVRGLKNKIPKSGSKTPSVNTMEDSRFTLESTTPVSSASGGSSPSRAADERLPIDLLTEMELLFAPSPRSRTPPASEPPALAAQEKAKTLSSSIPPRLPVRPSLPTCRYPIIPTRKLLDLSDAPRPPPRTNAPSAGGGAHLVSITKDERNGSSEFPTSTIRVSDGEDKMKLKLTLSNMRRPAAVAVVPAPPAASPAPPVAPRPAPPPRAPTPRNIHLSRNTLYHESNGSETDLIKLDDSPPDLEDFDPLKCKEKSAQPPKMTTENALLREYGLGQFGFLALETPEPPVASSVPKGWTTFN